MAGKPISLTQVDPGSYAGPTPQPYVLVGDLPSASYTETALTAVPASFADLAAVRAYLNTLVTELKGSPYFS